MIADWELAARAVRQQWRPWLPDWVTFGAFLLAYVGCFAAWMQRTSEQQDAADKARDKAVESESYDGTPSIYETRP